MTLDEQYRLSYYKKIAEISSHKNVCLVQHLENKRVFVKKEQTVYSKEIYEFLMQCNSPHIPKIYECIEDEGCLIIIEEYVQGESLEDRIERTGVYEVEEVCQIMIVICNVLEQLHHLPQPIIHRDLKPDNIIIQENGWLKIIDFNTAKQFDAGKDSDTVVIGTREFAAPEQYGFSQSDVRTDIYAIGVMLNYLLSREYPKNRLYSDKDNGTITKIIEKCIEFAPAERYQTVTELRRDLEKCIGKKMKIYQPQNVNVEAKEKTRLKGFWNNPLLLPGFRSGRIWKMVVALYGYYAIFMLCIGLEVTNAEGTMVTGLPLWVNRITMLLWMLSMVAFYTNYLGFRERFVLMKNEKTRKIGYWIFPFVSLLVLTLILVIAGV